MCEKKCRHPLLVMLLLWFVDGSQTHALPPVLDPTKSRVDQPVPEAPTPIVVGRSKRLFVNDWVVEQMDGMVRTMHAVSKHPDNPLFRPEESWEGHNVLLFGTVMYDPHREDDRFRMWYLCYDPLYNED